MSQCVLIAGNAWLLTNTYVVCFCGRLATISEVQTNGCNENHAYQMSAFHMHNNIFFAKRVLHTRVVDIVAT